ncbi:MAG: branched-chain amino acid transaminase [Alphaproteobacteria bacterium]|nr:branched-chain amino acid transaminase [Alphaproteobacteria bacterium]
MPTCEFMCLNGEIVPYRDAKIHAFSAVVKYGLGVFEGLRAYWNAGRGELYVFRLAEHIERLRFGMKMMRYDKIYDADYLEDCLIRMLRANEIRENAHIRMIAYVDGDDELIVTGPVGLVIGVMKLPPRRSLETGVKVTVSAWQRIADNALPPRVKCTANYVNNRAAELEAKLNGYDGVLMLTADGKLSEASGACIFLVRNGRLITPDVGSDILESITRDTVIETARRELGVAVDERRVDRSELHAADEVFWCGSGQEVVPVVAVDRLPVGSGKPGPLTRRVQQHYFKIVRGEVPEHAEWRTAVWQRN